MTLEKLCLKIESFKPDIKRKEIYILIAKYMAVMIMLGVFVCTAITSVTDMLALLAGGIFVVFGLAVILLANGTETVEMYGVFLKYMKFWWLALIIEVALSVVIKLFV